MNQEILFSFNMPCIDFEYSDDEVIDTEVAAAAWFQKCLVSNMPTSLQVTS